MRGIIVKAKKKKKRDPLAVTPSWVFIFHDAGNYQKSQSPKKKKKHVKKTNSTHFGVNFFVCLAPLLSLTSFHFIKNHGKVY